MPYTTSVAGTTITASWANANVRDQVVTPFATAAARSSAITSPVEGMLSFRTDADAFEFYNATAWSFLGPAIFKGYHAFGTLSVSVTGTSYADVTGPSVAITKKNADTSLAVLLLLSGFGTTTGFAVQLGVSVAGSDYDISQMTINTASQHQSHVGARLISGIAAGAQTVQLRGKNNTGSKTFSIDSGDTVSLIVAEVAV